MGIPELLTLLLLIAVPIILIVGLARYLKSKQISAARLEELQQRVTELENNRQ